ncbi:MAG: MHO_1590 family protein [Metamycoplasmataceae bacterium]
MNNNKSQFSKLKMNSIKKILIVSLPILIAGLSIGAYFIFINMNKEEIKENVLIPNPQDPSIDENNIFPEIDSKDFYNLIEFENGRPFIGDKMMAAIIKDIITRLGSVDGDLSFYIVEDSAIKKTIYFKWVFEKKELKKTYIISINSL